MNEDYSAYYCSIERLFTPWSNAVKCSVSDFKSYCSIVMILELSTFSYLNESSLATEIEGKSASEFSTTLVCVTLTSFFDYFSSSK